MEARAKVRSYSKALSLVMKQNSEDVYASNLAFFPRIAPCSVWASGQIGTIANFLHLKLYIYYNYVTEKPPMCVGMFLVHFVLVCTV